jgi:hypothetical protein
VPRDGYQGWTRAKETGWTRVFGEPELAPEMESALNEIFFTPARIAEESKAIVEKLEALEKCDPPCDSCKCVKP